MLELHRSLVALGIVASLTLAPRASAQSFNLDMYGYDATTIPSSSFGGPANQAGHWNAFNCASYCDGLVLQLADLTGAPTGVACTLTVSEPSQVCSSVTATGDLGALLGTGMQFSGHFANILARVDGLQPGTYDVYYCAGPRCPSTAGAITLVTSASGGPGSQWRLYGSSASDTLAEDANWGRTRVRTTGTIFLQLTGDSFMHAHGVQLVKLDGSVLPFCFGTNTSSGSCPCGGVGGWERGCPSSFQPLGARLVGNGAAQVSQDTLELVATDVSNSFVTFFQGTVFTVNGGQLGSAFGDGRRCAGGSVIRIATRLASGNTVSYPSPGDEAVSVRGALPGSGGLRVYQAWYRNSVAFCTADTFNLSNGLAVEWAP